MRGDTARVVIGQSSDETGPSGEIGCSFIGPKSVYRPVFSSLGRLPAASVNRVLLISRLIERTNLADGPRMPRPLRGSLRKIEPAVRRHPRLRVRSRATQWPIPASSA